ncbi:MAG: hypothetical protein JST40_07425 [Armatimonadetes bacterium]|nr:hypothetical protein [Armatimonadota bacterium]
MSECDAEVRDILLKALQYAAYEDDWSHPLARSLDGITGEKARWQPPEGEGIWRIVLHVTVWNRNILDRIRTSQPVSPAEGAWPEIPVDSSETHWLQAKEACLASLEELRLLIETGSLDAIRSSPGVFQI